MVGPAGNGASAWVSTSRHRSVYRDLEALAAVGVPVVTSSGPGGGCRLMEGYRFPLRGCAARWGGDWDGRSVAVEGFGKVGGGVAREVTRRGGRVIAVSTLAGCLTDPSGLDVDLLLALREVHGDACVLRYSRPAGPPGRLFTAVNADVIVPGTRPGMISSRTAEWLPPGVRVIAPAANVPYTAQGAEILGRRGIVALPDFVCNAGGVIGYRSPSGATPEQVLAAVGATITELIAEALHHRDGPLAGSCERAGSFLRSWWGEPPGPPFAPQT